MHCRLQPFPALLDHWQDLDEAALSIVEHRQASYFDSSEPASPAASSSAPPSGDCKMWLHTLAFSTLLGIAQSVPYSEYILAPSSRTINPVAVYNVNGTVDNAEGLLNGVNATATFSANSAVTYDFGKNIAGQVSVVAGNSAYSPDAVIWLTYSESNLWISGNASDATSSIDLDDPMYVVFLPRVCRLGQDVYV